MAQDRRVRQRAHPRMVRWSGLPLYQQALAPPYQDARSQHRPMSDRGRRITPIVQKTHFIRASRLQWGHIFEEQPTSSATPRAVLATTASEYGPLRRKNLALPKVASTIRVPSQRTGSTSVTFCDWVPWSDRRVDIDQRASPLWDATCGSQSDFNRQGPRVVFLG